MSRKIICITGVTSGVGRETARRFIREGWKVIGTGRRQARLDELKCSPACPPNSGTLTSF